MRLCRLHGFVIILCFANIGFAVNGFPDLELLTPAKIFAFPNDNLNIQCPIICRNCTSKVNVSWEKDGNKLNKTAFILKYSGCIQVHKYIPGIHDGTFVCIWKYREFILRSTSIVVETFKFPEFAGKNTSSNINGTALFNCFNPTSSINEKILSVKWFKSNDSEILVPTQNIIIQDQFIFIKNIQWIHFGIYRCMVDVKEKNLTKLSDLYHLNLKSKNEVLPSITYFTPSTDVKLNTTFTIVCFTNQLQNTKVHLFRVFDDGQKKERKLIEHDGYLIYTIKSFQVENAAVYVCEASHSEIRSRKESIFNFVNTPVISNKNIVHYNQLYNLNITLLCQISTSFPTPTVTWYHNGKEIQQSKRVHITSLTDDDSDGVGTKLFINNLNKDNTGIYQCNTENGLGSDMKHFCLTLGNSDSAPRNISTRLLSPVNIKITWLTPTKSFKNETFKVSWFLLKDNIASGQLLTKETEAVITDSGLYGGRTYKFLICVYFQETVDYSDCVVEYVTMPEAAPLKSPELFKPFQENLKKFPKLFLLEWRSIPAYQSMGVIKNYTIYCIQMAGYQVNQLQIFSQSPNENSKYIELFGNGTYRIWMTAFTDVGESPKSKSFYVQTEFLEYIHKGNIELSVSWGKYVFLKTSKATVNWKTPEYFTGSGFKLYYVPIPYTDYWNSVKSLILEKDVRQVRIKKLTPAVIYRFTIGAIYSKESQSGPYYIHKTLGKTSSSYLQRGINLEKSFKALLNDKEVINAPKELKCLSEYKNSLIITWQPPDTTHNIKTYILEIFSDKTYIRTKYKVEDTVLSLHNLKDGFWYGVRVHAYISDLDANFFDTPFISCVTREEVPSKPQNITYTFVYSKEESALFLQLRWQRPLYTGASTYSYVIRRLTSQYTKKNKLVQKIKYMYGLIDDEKNKQWLILKAIKTEGNRLGHDLRITAINDVGAGNSISIQTYVATLPDEWMNRKEPTVSQSTNHYKEESKSSIDLTFGVIIGVSISGFFLTILVAVCIIKQPCRKVPSTLGGGRNQQIINNQNNEKFLFVRKMKEMNNSRKTKKKAGRSYKSKKKKLKTGAFLLLSRSFGRLCLSKDSLKEDSGNTEEALCSISSGTNSYRAPCLSECESLGSGLQSSCSL